MHVNTLECLQYVSQYNPYKVRINILVTVSRRVEMFVCASSFSEITSIKSLRHICKYMYIVNGFYDF